MTTPSKTVAVFTGNRAEYGLFYPVLKALSHQVGLELQLIVSGDHLKLNTDAEIIKDGFRISHQIDSTPHTDNIQLSAALMENLNGYWKVNRPDCLLVLGDRYETFAVALAAFYQNIPIAHIGGGDITTGGCVDDKLRFMLSEMASLHFVISKDSAYRLTQRGFFAKHIFVTGSPVFDNILQTSITKKSMLCEQVGFNPNQPIVLFTQHPIPAEGIATVQHFKDSVTALGELAKEQGFQILATAPNQDGFANEIQQAIDETKQEFPQIYWVTSLGRQGYLSWLSACDVVAGNSSSGLIETPFFRKASVTIGPRQAGRLRGQNVLDCEYGVASVKSTILQALTEKVFQQRVHSTPNPFGEAPCAPEICKQLKIFLAADRLASHAHAV